MAGHAREARSRRSGGSRSCEHRLTGQRVPEPEPDAVDLDQLLVDGGPQRVDRRLAVDLGDAGEQLPVEAATQQRGGAEHSPGGGIERAEPAVDGLAQAGRHRGRQVSRPRPLAVLQPQLPDATSPASSSSTRNGLPSLWRRTKRDEVVGGRGHVEAGGDHPVDLGVGEAVEPDDGGRIVPLDPIEQLAGVAVRPGRDEAEHRLGAQRVGQVLDDREGLGVGPVEVLEQEEAPRHRHRGRRAGAPPPRRAAPATPRRRTGRLARPGPGAPRWLPNPASDGSSGGGVARNSARNASVRGRYGSGLAPGTARPDSTGSPSAIAASAVARAKRDFPAPASPTSATTPPRRSARSPTRTRSRSCSRARPTRSGHSTPGS